MSLHRLLGYALGLWPSLLFVPALVAQQSSDRPPLFVTEPKIEAKTRAIDLLKSVRRSPEVAAIERVRGAVVNIHTERHVPSHDFYGAASSGNRVNGMGTGIVIDPRGYIVTNTHVIEDVSVLRIRVAGGATYHAAVVAKSPEMDLALIKIDPREPLPTMPLGTSSDLMLGETVIAIGNAFGYEHTVSKGIVSALKRDVSLNKEMSYKSLIQTDAAINPGNSGGPLINLHGELVGVNVAIRAGAQNIGFAIPADHMVRTVAEMLKSKRRGLNYDGMVLRDRVECALEGCTRSVSVDFVDAGSPAAKAGIKAGDVLSQLGEVRIHCSYDVERALLDRHASETIPVRVHRKSEEQKIDLVLASPDRLVRPVSGSDLAWSRLGLQLAPVSPDTVKAVNKSLHGGLEVMSIQAESSAARAGIQKGDILVGLHLWETINLDNVTYVLTHPELTSFQPLSFFILRGREVKRGFIPSDL
jgi:serine protease Do